MSLVFKRKSVRRYTDEKVPDEIIENLLKAGMQAPSACNQQAWEFIVVTDREDKEAISKMHRFAAPAASASHLIVTLGNLNNAKSPQDDRAGPWSMQRKHSASGNP